MHLGSIVLAKETVLCPGIALTTSSQLKTLCCSTPSLETLFHWPIFAFIPQPQRLDQGSFMMSLESVG